MEKVSNSTQGNNEPPTPYSHLQSFQQGNGRGRVQVFSVSMQTSGGIFFSREVRKKYGQFSPVLPYFKKTMKYGKYAYFL